MLLKTHLTPDTQYLALLDRIRHQGFDRSDRTGVGSRMLFDQSLRHHLLDGFPALTTKKVPFKTARAELFFFLSGSTNIRDLDARIWDQWADGDGELGPVYGAMWRRFPGPDGTEYDQVAEAQRLLRTSPDSRRILIDAWHPGLLPDEGTPPHENPAKGRMSLAPCHVLYQFVSRPATEEERRVYAEREGLTPGEAPGRALNCLLFQRSGDTPVGLPCNQVELALLTEMMAVTTGHLPGEVSHTVGDCHVYQDQWPGVREQLTRKPLPSPILRVNRNVADIDDFRPEDLELEDYRHHAAIRFPVAT